MEPLDGLTLDEVESLVASLQCLPPEDDSDADYLCASRAEELLEGDSDLDMTFHIKGLPGEWRLSAVNKHILLTLEGEFDEPVKVLHIGLRTGKCDDDCHLAIAAARLFARLAPAILVDGLRWTLGACTSGAGGVQYSHGEEEIYLNPWYDDEEDPKRPWTRWQGGVMVGRYKTAREAARTAIKRRKLYDELRKEFDGE